MGKREELLCLLGGTLRRAFESAGINYETLEEIYIKTGQPVLLQMNGREWYLEKNGTLGIASEMEKKIGLEAVLRPIPTDLTTIVEYACNYSIYAHTQEIRQGFLTVKGGHRIGVAGEVILQDGKIMGMRTISFLTIRVAHAVIGCSDRVLPYLVHQGKVYNTLILSPPGFGKTTLLRDCIRQISDGSSYCDGKKVAVVDERSEIAACFQGVPQHSVGLRTIVLDGCPKDRGLMMLIRSMSPQVIAADEIGSEEEMNAIRYAMNCGCKLLCTMHAGCMEEVIQKPAIKELVEEQTFARFVFLRRQGRQHFYEIYNEKMIRCEKND
ncbi:MAG: stage III sporulation protein AA [Lachnospiraceae bacterium]